MTTGCSACDDEPGDHLVHLGTHWRVVAERRPVVRGKLYVTLLRHAESVADLTDDEARELGALLRAATAALEAELGAERVHVGVYLEELRHVHVHVTPRVAGRPRGNVPFALWQDLRRVLTRMRLVRAEEEIPADLVQRLGERIAADGGEGGI